MTAFKCIPENLFQGFHKPGYASIDGGCRSLDLENRGIRYFVCRKTNALISAAFEFALQ